MVENTSKSKKGGNKRSQINSKKEVKVPKEEIWVDLDKIAATEDIDELIELTKHENKMVKMRAV